MHSPTFPASSIPDSVDVAIIGGGPAGASAARVLAEHGHRVAVFERHEFPRFQIGESLLPASNAVFARLGLDETLRQSGYVEKRGASFVTEDGRLACAIDFTACPAVQAPITYQVPRDRFDALLLDHARQAGAQVLTGHRVREVELAADGCRLTVAQGEGSHPVDAAVVIDASGQAGLLSKRLGLRRVDPDLRNVALYAHYRGVERPPGPRAGDIRIVSRFDLGWIWLIPLPNGITSVGVVLPRERYDEDRGSDPAAQLDRLLASVPVLQIPLANAERVGRVRVAADFSYAPTAYAGDRWLLAGDAGSFLDPVFSTGVLLALESGIEAADAVHSALDRGPHTVSARNDSTRNGSTLDTSVFSAYDRRQRRRYRHFRRFVRCFYDPCFRDLFFQPTNRLGLLDAVVAALAGNWRPTLRERLGLGVFFTLAALQRRVTLVPRSHSGWFERWRSKGDPPCPTPSPSAP